MSILHHMGWFLGLTNLDIENIISFFYRNYSNIDFINDNVKSFLDKLIIELEVRITRYSSNLQELIDIVSDDKLFRYELIDFFTAINMSSLIWVIDLLIPEINGVLLELISGMKVNNINIRTYHQIRGSNEYCYFCKQKGLLYQDMTSFISVDNTQIFICNECDYTNKILYREPKNINIFKNKILNDYICKISDKYNIKWNSSCDIKSNIISNDSMLNHVYDVLDVYDKYGEYDEYDEYCENIKNVEDDELYTIYHASINMTIYCMRLTQTFIAYSLINKYRAQLRRVHRELMISVILGKYIKKLNSNIVQFVEYYLQVPRYFSMKSAEGYNAA